ncbi:DUF1465 family protein [Magnetospirillum sp. UT-4]|uniref:DUF1465 family protein n=1 Tax=Magnetospirillum sp. UT-4 TaxID=2681467 RepID=UPI00138475C8|nr:DUF1465 family protein [Magnetospirillum sp. UT-4]CAA7625584.1 conserved hypothetical protein [Magnetospirillum sp. UT-4]
MPQPLYFRRTYDETLTLMVEARNYLAFVERRESERRGGLERLRLSCEAMRVTSRLTQVMAWLLMQRAVHEGEIGSDEALAEPNRLSGIEVCLDTSGLADEALPGGLRSLLERSFSLYQRVSRLERDMLERLN